MLDKLRDQTGAKYPRHGVLPAILPPGARGIYGAAGAAGGGLYIPRARRVRRRRRAAGGRLYIPREAGESAGAAGRPKP